MAPDHRGGDTQRKTGPWGVEGRTGGSALEPGGGGARGRSRMRGRRGKHATVSFLASKCRLKLALSLATVIFGSLDLVGSGERDNTFTE